MTTRLRSPRRAAIAAAPALLLSLAIAGCTGTTAQTSGDGGEASGDTASDAAGAVSCDGADFAGFWDLLVDPALVIDPAPTGVLSLQSAADAIHFVYDAGDEYTTYGYQLGYIDDGTIFPNDSGILFPDGHPDAPDDNVFTVAGPMAPSGVDGGPYAGVLQIDATTSSGTTVIASLCVALATSD